jgi:DNA-binding SARP family transcriptional activator
MLKLRDHIVTSYEGRYGMTPDQITVQVLGTFSAFMGTRVITPNAAKQRQVLALLALSSGRTVPVPTLMEELWGDRPPRTAAATLQTYVFHLRARLAADISRKRVASEILRTTHSGYQLVCRTDVEEFQRLARLGREAAEAGDPRAVSELLGRALGLWRGPALADVQQGRILETDAAALEEMRLGVLERRIQADLSLNRHADLLGELTLLTARHPMNENFWGLLMAALYGAGHVARALGAFQRLRLVLNDELGVDPSPRLRRLQQAILSGAPAGEVDALLTADSGQPTLHNGTIGTLYPLLNFI